MAIKYYTGIDLGGDLIPSSDSTHDIGSNSVRFANIYADTLYGDGSNIINLADSNVTYDNSHSGMTATTVHAAIDELYDKKLDITALTSNITFYPTTANHATISGYKHLVVTPDDADYDDPAVNVSTPLITGADIACGTLASDAGILEGSTGIITITTIGNIRLSNSANDTASFYFKIYHRNSSGTETLMGTSGSTPPVSSSTYEQFTAAAQIDSTTFSDTDRIVIKFFGSKTGSNQNPQYQFQYGGSDPIRTLFPVPVSVVSHQNDAIDIATNTTGFNNILDSGDDNVQAALDRLDNLTKSDIGLGNVANTTITVTSSSVSDGTNTFNKYTLPADVVQDSSYAHIDVTSTSVTDGTNTFNKYTLPTASASVLGGIKVGSRLTIASGILSANDQTIGFAPLNSPTFTGTPAAPTATAGDNSTQIATTAFVSTAVANLVDSAPGTLDTLNELAAALGDDPNFATTTSTALGNRLRVDTASQGLNATQQSNGRTNLGLGTAATSASTDFVSVSGDEMSGDLTISKASALIKMGYQGGPHGINFYDDSSGSNELRWGFYYRTSPDTISFEAGGSSQKFVLDTSGNLDISGDLTTTSVSAEQGTSPFIQVKDTTNNNIGRLRAYDSDVRLEIDPTNSVASSSFTIKIDDTDALVIDSNRTVRANKLLKSVQTTVTKDAANKVPLDFNSYTNFYCDIGGTWSGYDLTALTATAVGNTGVIILYNSSLVTTSSFVTPTEFKTPNGDAIVYAKASGAYAVLSYYVASTSVVLVNYIGNYS